MLALAFSSLTPVRSAPLSIVSDMSTPIRLILVRFALVKLAPLSLVFCRILIPSIIPKILAVERSAPDKFASVRSAPVRIVFTS